MGQLSMVAFKSDSYKAKEWPMDKLEGFQTGFNKKYPQVIVAACY